MSGDNAIDLTGADDAGGDGTVVELEQQLHGVQEELQELEETLTALRSRQLQLQSTKEDLQRRITAERRAPKADWGKAEFAWDEQLQEALQVVFGLSAFRPLQREVINATLQGRDVLLLLPSGGGKSLCYQLPALISGGVTLVVSPLLSLIVDQVMGLSGRVQAYALTSLTSKEEAASVMTLLTAAATPAGKAAGKGKGGAGSSSSAAGASAAAGQQALLLYVTPEKIVASKRLMAKLEKVYQAGRLSRIAIDEAHCCSTWGNDFRPDYKKLGVLKQQFPETPIMALTATATAQVCRDVTSILRIGGCEQFSASINRPNLAYEVRHKPASPEAATEDICSWIQENYPNGESGIVYCLTRKDCEQLSGQLQAAGITAAHYHADMDPAARSAAHSTWSSGAVQVICATIAFGMGINKPDVRWVLHACLSKSLENYYQESGRAGRDGQPARCVLCYRLSDVLRQASVVCMDPSWQRCLMAITAYAAAAGGCRRAALAAHFGEGPPPCQGAGMCDICKAAAGNEDGGTPAHQQQQQQQQKLEQHEDITAAALCAIAALKGRNNEKRATLNQLLDDLQKAVKKAAAEQAKSAGSSSSSSGGGSRRGNSSSSSSMTREEHEWVVEQMLLQGLLGIEFGFTAYTTNTYLVATAAGDAFNAAQGRQRLTAGRPRWLDDPPASQQKHGGGQHKGQQQQQQQQVSGSKRRNSAAAHKQVVINDSDGSDSDFELDVGATKRRAG